jgi:two-component system, OmpR family, response regulator ChvI
VRHIISQTHNLLATEKRVGNGNREVSAPSTSRTQGNGVKPKAGPLSALVALVDDNDLFRETLTLNLSEAGYEVRSYVSGEAAVNDLVTDDEIAIVLLDWIMPGMNGIEVLRRIRAANRAVPVIFLTELTDQIYEEAALLGGAVDFIEKSRSFVILLQRIKLILEGAKTGPSQAATGAVVVVGNLELRRDTARAFWKGIEVTLTVTEFKMVDLLASRTGTDVRYRELYDLVHGEGFVTGSGADGYRANVRAFVKRIREKFRSVDEEWNVLENYSRFGYRWRDRTNEAS